MTAFIGFLSGFVGSVPIAWPYLQVGFQTGEITRGFAYFIGVIFGSGVIGGLAGLGVGNVLAWFWERGHRSLRRTRQHLQEQQPSRDAFMAKEERVTLANDTSATEEAATDVPAPDRRASSNSERVPVLLRDGGVHTAGYAALVARVLPGAHDPRALAAALAQTANIGAWEGERLVGIIRVLPGNPYGASVAELLVDPDYQRRGIGTDLVARALRLTHPI